MKHTLRPLLLVLLALLLAGTWASAQSPDQQPSGAPQRQALSAAQLDQLTAPIALYSDPLLGAVLTGSTYPLEIVEAARWLENPANAALRGEALANAMQQQSWDVSVKSLVTFPDVLRNMNSNLQWTEQLGDAFLAQQADVMDSVQRLRRQASTAGALHSSPQQVVSEQDQYVSIQPASPDVIYVPYYDPMIVYGLWPWAAYPPFYFGIAPAVAFDGGFIGFGVGIGIGFIGPYWGGWGWDWNHHGIYYRPHGPRGGPAQPWNHDPGHRGGVPYRNSATAARFGGEAGRSREAYRGYAGAGAPTHSPNALPRTDMASPREGGSERSRSGLFEPRAGAPQSSPFMPRAQPQMSRPMAPAFESYGHGSQVRAEAARGQSSRSAPAHGGGGAHHR